MVALFFLAASLITNFMHTVASYYPERNMLSSALFLIVGILIMVEEFWHRKIGIAVTCSCWILLVFFTVQFFHGSWDIYNTYAKCMARDRLAKEQIAAGEKNLTLPGSHTGDGICSIEGACRFGCGLSVCME